MSEIIYHATRFNDEGAVLSYGKQAPGLWRFFVKCYAGDSWHCVGEQYKTKDELLSDLNRYAETWGYNV